MNRTTFISIALLAGLMTPLVVNAAGNDKQVTKVAVADATVATSVSSYQPQCRRVRVVYASHIPAAACAPST